MATEQPIYDLILLLDPRGRGRAPRRSILADVSSTSSSAQGEVVGRHDWGVRPTAYEVRKRADADYHLIQFQGTPELLEQLDHTLKITDGVLRFRIIKLRPGTPAAAGPARRRPPRAAEPPQSRAGPTIER